MNARVWLCDGERAAYAILPGENLCAGCLMGGWRRRAKKKVSQFVVCMDMHTV